MTEELKSNNFLDEHLWKILYFTFFVAFFISFAWFIRDKGIESAISLICTLISFISFLFSKGSKGLNLGLGIILGSTITTLLFLFITGLESKENKLELDRIKNESKFELNQIKVEKSLLEEENDKLKNKIVELENLSSNTNSSNSVMVLRKKIVELNSKIEILEKQCGSIDKPSSGSSPINDKINMPSMGFSPISIINIIAIIILVFFSLVVFIGALMGKVSWGMAIFSGGIIIVTYILFYAFQAF